MAVKHAQDMDFSDKTFTMVLSGAPGLGKTTLALSAPDPFLFDLDKGIARVRAEHRKDCSEVDEYQGLLDDMDSEEYRRAKSVIIDTGGSLVQLMQPWAKTQDKRAATNGMAMFGVIKREVSRLTNQIRTVDHKNCIIVFHITEVTKGDLVTQRLSCEGSTKDIVWTPADFGGCMFMMGKKRVIGFTPTEEYFAKGCFGITGVREVPELTPGNPNTFLTDLFNEARENIRAEMDVYTAGKAAYDRAMEEGGKIIESVTDDKSATEAVDSLMAIKHGLTSKKELGAMLSAKAKGIGLKWDKIKGVYVGA